MILNLSAGKTYLLDFTADQTDVTQVGQQIAPMEITIEPSGGSFVNMEMSVSQGHFLVPVVAGNAGWYVIDAGCNTGWTFSSVQVNQLN